MTSPRPSVRPILYLPSLAAYRDRASLFGEVIRCAGGEGAMVISRLDADPAELAIADINLVAAPPRWRLPGRSAFGASRAVGALLRNGGYNVVHDTFGHLLPLMFRKRRYPGTVFVTSFHSLPEWDLRRLFWPRYRLATLRHRNLWAMAPRALTQRLLARLADSVVMQAPGLMERVTEVPGVPRSRVSWIPNNVVAPPDQPPGARVPRSGPITLLFVGGFTGPKGADKALSLLGRARRAGIDLRLRVLGGLSPVDRAPLLRRIRDERLADAVTIDERVPPDRVDEAYSAADWLFHVTDFDGSPRVVLEALARGLPVIGSRHPGVRVIDPDERFILFADPWDPGAVLNALARLRDDRDAYRRRSGLGRDYVLRNFSPRAVAPRYVELYSRLLADRAAVDADA